MIARSDFATTGSLVPPPADSGAVKFKLVTGGGEREAPDPSAIAAAVARVVGGGLIVVRRDNKGGELGRSTSSGCL